MNPKEILNYDPATGAFVWLVNRSRTAKRGAKAGRICGAGYVYIGRMLAHRVAWKYVTGKWPNGQIDHINGNRTDNRWSNLRLSTHSLNQQNLRSARADNKSGFLGVSSYGSRFRASIKTPTKRVHLGWFDTPEMAHAAYLDAKRRLHKGCTL
jgi:hypothetical protein